MGTVFRKFKHTTIEEDQRLGLVVRSMHPEQELAGDWRWAGSWSGRSARGRAAGRWAFCEYHGTAIRVIIDPAAPILSRTHVTRPLWDAWRERWPIERRYWQGYFASGQGDRDETLFAGLLSDVVDRELEKLNERARQKLGPALQEGDDA